MSEQMDNVDKAQQSEIDLLKHENKAQETAIERSHRKINGAIAVLGAWCVILTLMLGAFMFVSAKSNITADVNIRWKR